MFIVRTTSINEEDKYADGQEDVQWTVQELLEEVQQVLEQQEFY